MRIRKVDANAAQLRQYLVDRYNLPVSQNASRQVCFAKLQELGDEAEFLDVADESDAAETPGVSLSSLDPEQIAAALRQLGVNEKEARSFGERAIHAENASRVLPVGDEGAKMWMTIRLSRGRGPYGGRPIPVGVNGAIQLIPRGENVEVRVPYVEALRHAIEIVYDKLPNPDGLGELLVPREVPRFPIEFQSAAYATKKGIGAQTQQITTQAA